MSAAAPSRRVLVVDDDPGVVEAVSLALGAAGLEAVGAAGPEEALRLLDDPSVDAIVQDMNFSRETSGEEGLALLDRVRELHPDLPVVLLTAWGSIELAVEGLKRGASDFLTKPWSNERLVTAVETVLELGAGTPMPEGLDRDELDRRWSFRGLVGRDPVFLAVLELVGRVAPTDAPVLVLGESGTGKELVARALHENSRRRDGPFVSVNLGGVPQTLFESEMFGHVRGAFTGARADRVGRFPLAEGGTIFLDEVGDVDLGAQVKLLRVLQDRTYEVLGASRTRRADVRVVSATNRDLATAVEDGSFREDLLYRLNLITLRLPPLRERRGDIRELASTFLDDAVHRYGRSAELGPRAFRWLEEQPWPGNVRQLRQTVERAVLVHDGRRIDEGDLATLEAFDPAPSRGSADLPAPGTLTLGEVEEAMVRRALEHYSGNVSRAAESLGLSRPALYRRLEKYGLAGD